MLSGLPCYDELNIIKAPKAFKRYAKGYSIEITNNKDENIDDSSVQLGASKPVVKDFFRNLLIEVLLSKKKKEKENLDTEFETVYFNSTAKKIINFNKYGLGNSFQELLYRIDNWINKGSAWTIEYIDAEYINSPFYNPLSGSSYIELPDKLINSMKDLTNIKNNNSKCFLWCHIGHLNPLNKDPQRITKADKADKNMVNDLDYEGINFPVSKKDYSKI